MLQLTHVISSNINNNNHQTQANFPHLTSQISINNNPNFDNKHNNKKQNKMKRISSETFFLFILCSVIAQLCLHFEQVSCAGRILSKRQHDRDFAPRLTHQPHSVSIQANAPHTSECPVESQPDSDVKWFKDNRLLASEPMHLEQTGSELMFFQINDNDTGDYHCEASNYLGKVTSEPFRLTVQTSQLDEDMQLEPRTYVAVELQEQSVEFKCTLPVAAAPTARRSSHWPEVVSWRKNGRRLQQVAWLSESAGSSSILDSLAAASATGDDQTGGRYFARRGERPNEFILTIARVTRARDDNSTFTCLYKPSTGDDSMDLLAHESRSALLRVEAQQQQQQQLQPVKLNIPMGVPMVELNSSSLQDNHTTQLSGGELEHENQLTNQTATTQRQRIRTTLSETLADLYEIAKPTLMIFGVMSFVLVIVLLQFLLHRRRATQLASHRYTKHNSHLNHKHNHSHLHPHHQLQYSSASSSSANSGACTGIDGSATLSYSNGQDPVLSSLLSRTLSATTSGGPTLASSLSCVSGGGGGGGGGKKYKSYRDHMRKVGDAQLVDGVDFIDASAYLEHQHQQQQQQQQQQAQNHLFAQTSGATHAVPNLYDQSLAAREQARSLLMYGGAGQAADHMRSLGGGNVLVKQQRPDQQHLELPLSFSNLANTNAIGPLETGAANLLQQAYQVQGNAWTSATQQQQLVSDQHYQLMSCSSVSPSSSSSILAASGVSSTQGSNSSATQPPQQQQQQHCDTGSGKQQPRGRVSLAKGRTKKSCELAENNDNDDCSSLNHYSTIETTDDNHQRGDEPPEDQDQDQDQDEDQDEDQYEQVDECDRPAAFVRSNNKRMRQGRCNNTSARSSLISSRSTNSSACCDSSDTWRGRKQPNSTSGNHNNTAGQLSPYAVSSICNFNPSAAAAHRQVGQGSSVPSREEAMRALDEQFDINQLVMLDNGAEQLAPPRLPFTLPPPPPPPRNH